MLTPSLQTQDGTVSANLSLETVPQIYSATNMVDKRWSSNSKADMINQELT